MNLSSLFSFTNDPGGESPVPGGYPAVASGEPDKLLNDLTVKSGIKKKGVLLSEVIAFDSWNGSLIKLCA